MCTFILHIQEYTCAREKDIREKGPRNLKSTHATYADNYINKNVYNVSKVNVMAYMHCMIPGQRKV